MKLYGAVHVRIFLYQCLVSIPMLLIIQFFNFISSLFNSHSQFSSHVHFKTSERLQFKLQQHVLALFVHTYIHRHTNTYKDTCIKDAQTLRVPSTCSNNFHRNGHQTKHMYRDEISREIKQITSNRKRIPA